MPHQEQDPSTGPVMWRTGREYNDREGLHLWAEVNGARVEIRKRVSRLLGRSSNGYRVWEVFVDGERQPASHSSLRAAKAAVEGTGSKVTDAQRATHPPAPPLWAAMLTNEDEA